MATPLQRLPLRAFTASISTALSVAEAGLRAGREVAGVPLREGGKALSGELSRETLSRRCWRGADRAWIEVRGLDGDDGGELGPTVLDAVLALPGVTSATLNYPLSRVVIELGDQQTSLRHLCRAINDAEKSWRPSRTAGDRQPSPSLPGDEGGLALRAATVAANAAGLSIALTGRALRLPGAPNIVAATVSLVDYQPWLRRGLEAGIGGPATDAVITFASTAAQTVTFSPSSLGVGLAMQSLKAAETRAEAEAFRQHEPELARHCGQRPAPPVTGRKRPSQPAARHVRQFAMLQAASAGLAGVFSRNLTMAADAVLVTAPKASRTTPEAFAATLGRGLATDHAVLPLRPEALRRLDLIDAIVIDPRVLCTGTLRVARIRGADDSELSAAWNRAQLLLEKEGLSAGWHPVSGISSKRQGAGKVSGKVEALFLPSHDPLAAAVVAEAHRSGAELITVDADSLDELRPAFDDVRPLPDEADEFVDDALAGAVAQLHEAGKVVAVLSSASAQAISYADLALGLKPQHDDDHLPWHADLLLPDLAAAWRVLHALPAARTATSRGVGISLGATAMGSLFMIPGVRALGPGPVNIGAAAGLLSGVLLARGIMGSEPPRPAAVHEWHAMSPEQVQKALPPPAPDAAFEAGQVEQATGLGHDIVHFLKAVQAELSDPLTPVMALGSAASAVLGSPIDAMLVGTVLAGNSVLSAAQRLRAENRLSYLLAQHTAPTRKVVTGADGKRTYVDVDAALLRPGDVIEVRTHEVVPADARILEEVDLEVDESTLTGESLSVDKQVEATPGVPLAERRCMLFAGTTVVAGTAVALVTAVGADTQERRAADLISGELSSDIGLQHQLGQLTNQALPVSVGGGVLVGALGVLRRMPLAGAVSSGIAIAVAAVPEGMPLVATLAQAASARRLTKYGALVRVPRSVEALGRLDVVCFDKTGTLSENRLRVSTIHAAAGDTDALKNEVLRCAAHAAPVTDGGPQIHATDNAIVEAAAAAGVSNDGGTAPTRPTAHLPFRSGRAFSATLTGTELTIKGAPEVVLAAAGEPELMDTTVAGLAAQGLRVIAVGQRRLTAQQAKAVEKDPDTIGEYCADGLTLIGLLGLSDTPRAQSASVISSLQRQAVGIKLITGDHPITAKAIAAELGLAVHADQIITGAEWDSLSRKEQERVVTERVIFARMTPENKVQVVQTLESAGVRTAMVGDGANDAAAIRAATVGIGVVAHGSDSAHLVADVVLVDGRIEALLDAIDEGRQLWRRVQAAVSVLLGGNAGEVIFAIIGSAITGTSPLNTRQLLLVNTVTDAFPAAALAVSKPSGPVDTSLRGADQSALWRAVAIRGVATAGATTAAWGMARLTGFPQRASTVALVALVGAELGQTLLESQAPLVLLTALGSLGLVGVLINTPGVSQLIGCTPLDPLGWAQGLGAATVATLAVGALTRLTAASDEPTPLEPDPAPRLEVVPDPELPPEPPRRATRTHRVPSAGHSATRQPAKLTGRPGGRSST